MNLSKSNFILFVILAQLAYTHVSNKSCNSFIITFNKTKYEQSISDYIKPFKLYKNIPKTYQIKNNFKSKLLSSKLRKKRFSKMIGIISNLTECVGAQCMNGGTCVTNVMASGGYECVCRKGYYGPLCDQSQMLSFFRIFYFLVLTTLSLISILLNTLFYMYI